MQSQHQDNKELPVLAYKSQSNSNVQELQLLLELKNKDLWFVGI
jgi:hypothetical protein